MGYAHKGGRYHSAMMWPALKRQPVRWFRSLRELQSA